MTKIQESFKYRPGGSLTPPRRLHFIINAFHHYIFAYPGTVPFLHMENTNHCRKINRRFPKDAAELLGLKYAERLEVRKRSF